MWAKRSQSKYILTSPATLVYSPLAYQQPKQERQKCLKDQRLNEFHLLVPQVKYFYKLMVNKIDKEAEERTPLAQQLVNRGLILWLILLSHKSGKNASLRRGVVTHQVQFVESCCLLSVEDQRALIFHCRLTYPPSKCLSKTETASSNCWGWLSFWISSVSGAPASPRPIKEHCNVVFIQRDVKEFVFLLWCLLVRIRFVTELEEGFFLKKKKCNVPFW